MRAAIRKIGTQHHGHAIQVRLDNGEKQHKRKKGSTSLSFDVSRHVRTKGTVTDTPGWVGEETTDTDSDEVCGIRPAPHCASIIYCIYITNPRCLHSSGIAVDK